MTPRAQELADADAAVPAGKARAPHPAAGQELRAGDGLRIVLGHLLVWFLGMAMLVPGLDRYGDMHELYAWSQPLAWGTFKHPPLLTWIVGAWFTLLPTRDWAFQLLAALNTAVAIWVIGRLTRAVLADDPRSAQWGWLAMAAAALSLSHGNLALKLNMNSVLLPLWPLAAWAWWHALQRRSLASALWLAAAGLACMLGKYYSGVFLLSLLLATLAMPAGRAWLRTPLPYLSIGVFLLGLLPHLGWVAAHDYVSWRYVADQGGSSGFTLQSAAKFLAMGVAPWLPAVGLLAWAGWPWRRQPLPALAGAGNAGLGAGRVPALLALLLGPAFFSLILALAMGLELSSPWALPLGYAAPALALALWQPTRPWPALRSRVFVALGLYWALMLAGGVGVMWDKAQRGHIGVYQPFEELGRWVDAQALAPAWVGGDWRSASALAFYSQHHPRAFLGLPTQSPGSVHAPADWAARPGLFICPRAGTEATRTPCVGAALDLAAAHGLQATVQPVSLQREGWRYPRTLPFWFDLVWVVPAPR